MGCDRFEIPEIWYISETWLKPARMRWEITPPETTSHMQTPVTVAEWDPIGYNASATARRFGLAPYQACAVNSFAGNIAFSSGIPLLGNNGSALILCGSGETALGIRDFIYFAPPRRFRYWVFLRPIFIDISEADSDLRISPDDWRCRNRGFGGSPMYCFSARRTGYSGFPRWRTEPPSVYDRDIMRRITHFNAKY